MLKEKLSAAAYRSLLIILAAAAGILIVLFGRTELGYSPKENEVLSVNGAESGQMEITDSYTVQMAASVSKNILLKDISVSYCAPNEGFSGTLVFSVSDGEGESVFWGAFALGRTSDAIETKTFDVAKHLLEGETYSVSCNVIVNTGSMRMLLSNFRGLPEGILYMGTEKGTVLSGYGYQDLERMRWGDVFPFFLPVLFALFLFVLVRRKYNGADGKFDKAVYKVSCFIRKNYSDVFLAGIFLFMALFVFYYAYCVEIHISPDSSNYMRAADSILRGNGFYYMAHSGDRDAWFATWPIGYPFLIACMAFIFQRNVYLASKILSVLLAGVLLILLRCNFKKDAWLYSFCLVNLGFLSIYKFTWSETPFIPALVIFALVLTKIVTGSHVKKRWYVFLCLSCVLSFSMRYFGAVTVMIAAVFLAGYIALYLLVPKFNTKETRGKIAGLFWAEAASTAAICSYLYMNYRMAGSFTGQDRAVWKDDYYQLAVNLYDALLQEICNAVRLAMPATFSLAGIRGKAAIALLFLGAVLYLGWKKADKVDYRFIFIFTGILYDAAFIFIRFHSSMDGFGYRFFVPGSILVMVGVIGFFKDGINRHIWQIYPVAVSVLAICIGTLAFHCREFNASNTAFADFTAQIQEEYGSVPPDSLILGFAGDYRLFGIRTDISYTAETIKPEDEIEDVFAKYAGQKYISVSNEVLKEIAINSTQAYTRSVVDFFAQYINADTPDSGYTTFLVQDRSLVH